MKCDMCGTHLWLAVSVAFGRCRFCRLCPGAPPVIPTEVTPMTTSPVEPVVSGVGKDAPTVAEPGHPEFLKLLDATRELHNRKAADYGRGADPFANVRASAEFGIPAWVGVMVRAGDKLHRIKSFIANGSLKNESVEDSLMDLAAYSLIALVLLREEQKAKAA